MRKEFTGHLKVGKSFLYNLEQRFVFWGTPKIPKKIETWTLTYMTSIWSILVLFFGYIAQYNIHWLWGSSFMIVAQYLTDLFDGAIGRYRNTGLVKWGYYADHFLDYIFMCCILIGYNFFIPDPHNVLFYILAIYGAFLVNAFISFAAIDQFKISYLGFGPTEARIGFILVNTMLIIFGKGYLSQFLPYLMIAAFIGLLIVVYRTQNYIWKIDMKDKKNI